MSGDLPIRKARTKREKNKSYNDSRNKFRASLKPERTDSSPSEDDDKIKEKKMKVDGQAEIIGQSTHSTNEDKEKHFKAAEEVDEKTNKITETKETSPATKEQNDHKDGQHNDKETGEIKNSEVIATAESSKKVTEQDDEAQGCSNSHNNGEKNKTANKKNMNKEHESDEFLWDEMFDSDEDGKPIHAKGSKKKFKVGIPTPPAKTTSEEENTDDEEKDDDSDANEKIKSQSNNYDKDNEGNGGGSCTKGQEGDGSGDADGGETGGKDGDDIMSTDGDTGGAGGDIADSVDGDHDNETEDDEEPPDDINKIKANEQSADEELEGGDRNAGERNLVGVFDPYDFSYDEGDEEDDDEDVRSPNYYDRYEFLSQDGGSDFSDISFGGEEYQEDELHDETPSTEVRGAG